MFGFDSGEIGITGVISILGGLFVLVFYLTYTSYRQDRTHTLRDGILDSIKYETDISRGVISAAAGVTRTVIHFKGQRPYTVDGKLKIKYSPGTHLVLQTCGGKHSTRKIED